MDVGTEYVVTLALRQIVSAGSVDEAEEIARRAVHGAAGALWWPSIVGEASVEAAEG